MKTLLVAALFVAAAPAALAASARDETVKVGGAGFWSVYYHSNNSIGNPMCRMQTTARFRSGGQGMFMVKTESDGSIFVHVSKSSWRIPEGAQSPISLQFDRGPAYTANGKRASASMIGWIIKDDLIKEFLDLLANANTMTLSFRSGSEPDWPLDMRGSREATVAFARCTLALERANTQPYSGSGGATQPFGNNGGATQPFERKPRQPPRVAPALGEEI